MESIEDKPFGELLGQFRTEARLSQQKLADKLGVSRGTIVNWEQGDNLPKTRGAVLELAMHLSLSDAKRDALLKAALLNVSAPIWHVPYHRNPLFIGREEILQELHRVLIPGAMTAVAQSRAISGLGGIGKTQTALEYAYRYREDYSAIIWLQADSREIFFLACVQLAQELGLPEQNEADRAYIVAAVKRWLKSRTKWLLILDNVEDLSMIEEFLPSGHHGCVLLTTRARQVTEHIALVHELEVLPEEEGILLLLRRAGLLALDASPAQANPVDYAQTKELWEMVEGLPLALDQIGAYVHATGCSLAHYRTLYVDQQRRLDLLKLRGKIPPGHPESVAATFSVAFEKVQVINPAAAEMLLVCAFLHPKAIPEEIITKGEDQLGSRLSSLAADPLLLDQAVDVLQTYSLIQRDAQNSTLSMHRLVQAVLQDTMSGSEQEMWTKRIIAAMKTVFPDVEYTTWSQCARLVPHVLTCITRRQFWLHEFIDFSALVMKTAEYLEDRAQYIIAQSLYLFVLSVSEAALGPDAVYSFYPRIKLATLYIKQGRYAEAEPLYWRAIRLSEQALGPDHPDVAHLLNNLAALYANQSKNAEAGPLYWRVFHIWKQALGPDHPNVADALHELAILYTEQGKYAEAEPLYQRALRIREQHLGTHHPETAETIHDVALFQETLGNHQEALSLYQRAFLIREQALGQEHPKTRATHQRLTALLHSLSQETPDPLQQHSQPEQREQNT